MTPSCSSISYFPSAQTRNSRNGPTATFPEDSIPAHAGKTPGMDTTSHCVSAHPRSRGENGIGTRLIRGIRGSSPLTRGKPDVCYADCQGRGLIPAHAGKTKARVNTPQAQAAHPRSRGENASGLKICMTSRGSSPLTRGKLSNGLRSPSRPRLIPAHAGKTRGSVISRASTPAHPRSRGENAVFGLAFGLFPGSSPLTRGKPADLF